jgi:hypothetical protein
MITGGHGLAFHRRFRAHPVFAVGDEAVRADHHVAADRDAFVGVDDRVAVHVGPVADLDLVFTRVSAAKQHDASVQRATVEGDVLPLARDLDRAQPAVVAKVDAQEPVGEVAQTGGRPLSEAMEQANHVWRGVEG